MKKFVHFCYRYKGKLLMLIGVIGAALFWRKRSKNRRFYNIKNRMNTNTHNG